MATIYCFKKTFTSNVEMTVINPLPELVLRFWLTEGGGEGRVAIINDGDMGRTR